MTPCAKCGEDFDDTGYGGAPHHSEYGCKCWECEEYRQELRQEEQDEQDIYDLKK